MDGVGFDELTKQLGAPMSRRRMLRAVTVSGATGAVALLGRRQPAVAAPGRCRKLRGTCRTDDECCSGFCNPGTGRCQCPDGTRACGPKGRQQCVRCFGGGTLDPQTCTCRCP